MTEDVLKFLPMDGPLHDPMTLWLAGMRAVDEAVEARGHPAPEVWLVGQTGRWVLDLSAFDGKDDAPCLGRTLHLALATPGVLRLLLVVAYEDINRHTLATVLEPYEGCGQPRWFAATRNLAWAWWKQQHGVGHPPSPWLELLSPSRTGRPMALRLAPPAPPTLRRVRTLARRPIPRDALSALRFATTLLLPWAASRPAARVWVLRMGADALSLELAASASEATQTAEAWGRDVEDPVTLVAIMEVRAPHHADVVVELARQRATGRAWLGPGGRAARLEPGATHPVPENRAWTSWLAD